MLTYTDGVVVMLLDHISLAVLMPTYNDWPALRLVVERMNQVLRPVIQDIHLLIVDDNSETPCPESITRASDFKVTVLRLTARVGHQKAIAIGLRHFATECEHAWFAVMDSDGQDDPADLLKLLTEHSRVKASVSFAERATRPEGIVFRTSYKLFQGCCNFVTGSPFRVGNFSVISPRVLPAILTLPFLEKHFAASVCSSRLSVVNVPVTRRKRAAGHSHMSWFDLVRHGLAVLRIRTRPWKVAASTTQL